MEIRVLEYFLEIAREGNMSRAANNLNISQPTLSKQMGALEEELGKKLFTRIASGLVLTDEGMLLRKRAEDIVGMVNKTTSEFKEMDNIQGGEVFIGCAESHLIRHLATVLKNFRNKYPLFQFHITSGNTEQVVERLERGLLDFSVIVEPPDLSRFNYLEIPGSDTLGLLLHREHPLAQKEYLAIEDLYEVDLIASKQAIEKDLPRWCGEDVDKINLIGTINLTTNGAFFVQEGFGALLTFEYLRPTSDDSDIVFRPLHPLLEAKMYVIWKKYQVFSPIASLLLEDMKKELTSQ